MKGPAFIRLELPYPPTANLYWRQFRGRMVISPEAKEYKRGVALRHSGLMPLHGPVELRIRVYRPRRRGDLDNALKVALDALIGLAWLDDDQVVHIDATRFDDPGNPRLELEAVGQRWCTPDEVEGRRIEKAVAKEKRAAKLRRSRQNPSPLRAEEGAPAWRSRVVPNVVRAPISMRELLLHELDREESGGGE